MLIKKRHIVQQVQIYNLHWNRSPDEFKITVLSGLVFASDETYFLKVHGVIVINFRQCDEALALVWPAIKQDFTDVPRLFENGCWCSICQKGGVLGLASTSACQREQGRLVFSERINRPHLFFYASVWSRHIWLLRCIDAKDLNLRTRLVVRSFHLLNQCCIESWVRVVA